jgi:hypothetical protein
MRTSVFVPLERPHVRPLHSANLAKCLAELHAELRDEINLVPRYDVAPTLDILIIRQTESCASTGYAIHSDRQDNTFVLLPQRA